MARTPISAIAQFAPCTINIRGKVAFSRIASRIEGQELATQNMQAAAKGRIQHAKPYIFITINNPVILDNGKLPEQVKNCIQERFFARQDGTVCFTQESKSPFLPTVVYSGEAGELKGQGIADKDNPLQAELARDLDVTLGVNLYSKNGFSGLGLNYVLINEPIRYYSNSALASTLEAQGITYTPVQPTAAPAQQAPAAPVAPQAPVYTAPQAPAAPQAPVYTPQAPVYTPQAPVYAAPQAPQAPVAPQPAFAESDLPFNGGSASPSLGVEPQQQVQRPVRYY